MCEKEKRKLDRVSFKRVHKDLRKIERLSIPLFDLIPELIPTFHSLLKRFTVTVLSLTRTETNDFKLPFD